MKKRVLSALIALIMLAALLPASVSAAEPKLFTEFFPAGKLEAPRAPFMTYEEWIGGDLLYIWYNTPHDILELQKAYGLWEETEDSSADGVFNDRFGVENFEIWIQTDCRVDGGPWQYTSAWDDPKFLPDNQENMPHYLVFCAMNPLNKDLAKAYDEFTLSWLTYIENGDTGFLDPGLTSEEDEYGKLCYHFDLANHNFAFRCRMMLAYQEESGDEWQAVCSDWSPETSIGKNGTQKKLAAPTSIAAPKLENFRFEVDEDDETGYQFTGADYYLNIPDSVYDGILYCCAQEGMYDPYRIDAQMRVNGGEWKSVYTGNETWIFSSERGAAPDTGVLTENDSVEIRARLVCEELGLVSDWSNVIGSKPSFQAHGWAAGELEEAAALGLIPECLQGADLTQPITRAEFAAVSVKVYESLSGAKAEPIAVNPFTDTNDEEVLKAFNVGVTNGMSDTTFEPETRLNRQTAATMLTRVYKKVALSGWTLETDGSYNEQFKGMFTQPEPFADDADISGWAKDSVYFMAANGIINGVGDNKFAPRAVTSAEEAAGYAQATREQALLIATRMVKNLG
ncbi:MAG: S-layer homology domain-containing protein [Oscillospiraceae bacterium]|nr:S-layer homology domain-containing protein [Oscillospiraceae bacterium]